VSIPVKSVYETGSADIEMFLNAVALNPRVSGCG
jgi:hypothetical protein